MRKIIDCPLRCCTRCPKTLMIRLCCWVGQPSSHPAQLTSHYTPFISAVISVPRDILFHKPFSHVQTLAEQSSYENFISPPGLIFQHFWRLRLRWCFLTSQLNHTHLLSHLQSLAEQSSYENFISPPELWVCGNVVIVKALYKIVTLTVAWMGLYDAWAIRWACFLIGDQKLYVVRDYSVRRDYFLFAFSDFCQIVWRIFWLVREATSSAAQALMIL